jgi:excisionase family DNA binding protein
VKPETEVLTVPEAARYLRIHEQTVYSLLRTGRLAGRKVGRAWRIHLETLEAYVKDSSAGKPSPRVPSR